MEPKIEKTIWQIIFYRWDPIMHTKDIAVFLLAILVGIVSTIYSISYVTEYSIVNTNTEIFWHGVHVFCVTNAVTSASSNLAIKLFRL